MTRMPAISLVATPTKRAATIEAAKEAEKRGFTGVYCPSLGDCLGLCQSIAEATKTMIVATSIQPIYYRLPFELARSAGYIHEVSKGRFQLGIGVSHGPMHERFNIKPGKPLSDIRNYVADMRKAEKDAGGLPPIILATLRNKMLSLAGEIADGAVWANGSRSAMKKQLQLVPEAKRKAGFFLGDMIPTVIDDDEKAAAAINRRILTGYVALPNYRNYWKEAGYREEMEAIEQAIARNEMDKLPSLMSDKWLSDNTLYGSVRKVRDGIEAWFDAGLTPIIVPSSTKGGQLKALEELFAAYA